MTYSLDELIFDKGVLESEINNLIKEFEKKYPVVGVTNTTIIEHPGYGEKPTIRFFNVEVKIN